MNLPLCDTAHIFGGVASSMEPRAHVRQRLHTVRMQLRDHIAHLENVGKSPPGGPERTSSLTVRGFIFQLYFSSWFYISIFCVNVNDGNTSSLLTITAYLGAKSCLFVYFDWLCSHESIVSI